MEPRGMDVAMELICNFTVVNCQGDVIEDLSKGSIVVGNMNYKSTPSAEPFITVHTSSDNTGTKYNLIANIEDLSTEFSNEGRASVCLKEPNYNIIITKADPNELTEFITYLKPFLTKDSPLHVSLDLPNPQINLHLDCQEKYKRRMKNILRKNTNLGDFAELKISDCILELSGDQVPFAGAIRKMKNLTTLQLKHIDLRSSTFLEIESKQLRQLYLCYSKTPLPIASLFKNDPCYKDSLVELLLSRNEWSEIPNAIFQFRNLCGLSLSHNHLTELPDKFMKLPKLQVLDLSFNQLRRVPPSIFALQNLSHLSLNFNFITELPNISINSSKLQVLLLSNNGLRTLPPSIFECQNLSELFLDHNRITELPDMFAVPPSIFAHQNLSTLSLSNNLITELPDIINLPKLQTLLLCNNRLKHVPSSIFESQNLSSLSLSYNLITELPDRFTNLSKLKYLSFDNNQLQYLPPSICSLHLETLDIADNPFNLEIPPSVGSELIVHSLKELSYRTILNHKLKVEEGMLPEKFLKDLDIYRQCVCGCKYVDEGQDVLFFCNLNDILNLTFIIYDPHLRVPFRGKMCNSLKSCFLDRFTKCK